MNKAFISTLLCGALSLSLLTGCGGMPEAEPSEPMIAVEDTSDVETASVITFSGGSAYISGDGAQADGAEVKIRESGSYRITGSSDEARVVVDTNDAQTVTIILAGCDLTCPDDEVIYFKSASNAQVLIADGTENILTSGSAPENGQVADADEEASGAALRSKCPLTISGGGKLTVEGYINNGIACSADLTIDGGIIDVIAANDGVKSKEDAELRSGILTVTSSMDGIQADGNLMISGGTLCVTTGGGAENAPMKVSDSSMMGRSSGEPSRERRSDTEESAGSDEPDEADSGAGTEASQEDTVDRTEGAIREMPFSGMGQTSEEEDSVSRKGLKAGGTITVSGGSVMLDTADDAIHCDGDVFITGGELEIHSADDGVHSDTTLTVSGGTTDVKYCYEGFEAKAIHISYGLVSIVATDDGMNVNGGNSFGPGRASQELSDEEQTKEDGAIAPELRITGGIVVVDSGGDGLDSNGSIYIEGGATYVSGPSTDWDAAIDSGDGSGYEFLITGGILMAGGYSGMLEAPDSSETAQASIYYRFADYAPDNAPCILKDADGNIILECSFAHSSNCVVLSSPAIQVGETYTLCLGDQQAEIEMTSLNFSNRSLGRGGMARSSREMDADAGSTAAGDASAE